MDYAAMKMELVKQTIKILLVEDNPADAERIVEFLNDEPKFTFKLTHAATLEEGLAIKNTGELDMILLDLFLPDSSGEETFKTVQEHFPDVPVIIFSGLKDENKALEIVRAGAQDYIIKDQLDKNILVRVILYAIERQRVKRHLQDLALLDDLTGLYNRRGFYKLAEQQMLFAGRQKRGLSFFIFDLNGFKQINDTFGHAEGDVALRRAADILKVSFRGSDIVARIGGDEFAVLTTERLQESVVDQMRIKLKSNLDSFNPAAARYELSFSMGVASFDPENAQSLDILIRKADAALYRDKERNKG